MWHAGSCFPSISSSDKHIAAIHFKDQKNQDQKRKKTKQDTDTDENIVCKSKGLGTTLDTWQMSLLNSRGDTDQTKNI